MWGAILMVTLMLSKHMVSAYQLGHFLSSQYDQQIQRDYNLKKTSGFQGSIIEEDFRNLQKSSWADLSDSAANSVAQLFSFCNIYNWFEPYKTPEQRASSGTAFFIDSKGHMITNAHCVDQAKGLFIQLPRFGKHRFEVELVAICPERDLALLRLTEEARMKLLEELGEIPYLTFGNSDTVRRADEIMALGFPLGQEWLKSTTGVVSGIQSLGAKFLIQISAAINPGNSGGPALNNEGNVIGVSTLAIQKEGVQNVGYIIPGKEVLIFLDHLRAVQESQKDVQSEDPLLIRIPVAGIVYHGSPLPLIEYLKNPLPGGIYIIEVLKGSLVDLMGIRPGDMIYSLNGYEVDRFGDMSVPWSKDKISLSSFICQLRIGELIKIVVYRSGERLEFSALWEVMPPLPIRMIYPGYEHIPYLIVGGMVIMPVTINLMQLIDNGRIPGDLLDFIKITNQTKPAVMVAHVLPNSVAQHSRIMHPGMVLSRINDQEVSTIEECERALTKSLETNYVTFTTKSNEFFVAKLDRVLEDERKLSNMYFYHISPAVESLMQSFKDE